MRTHFFLFLAFLLSLPAMASSWVVKESRHDVAATVERFSAAVEEKGARVFATIDHAAGAASVGQTLEPTTVVVWGNPKVGTALMKINPRVGLDLPLRVLFWREGDKTRIGYEPPQNLKARYQLSGADETLAKMAGLLDQLTQHAGN